MARKIICTSRKPSRTMRPILLRGLKKAMVLRREQLEGPVQLGVVLQDRRSVQDLRETDEFNVFAARSVAILWDHKFSNTDSANGGGLCRPMGPMVA
eukprot:scaffold731_cov261-Pinguiococcus_pyrenoidosus.AAC.104